MFTPPGTSVLKALCGRVYSTSFEFKTKEKYQLFPFTVNAGMEAGFLDSPYFWSESSTDSLKDFISQNDLAAVERESGWSLWIKKGPLSDSTHDFRQAASTVIPIARRAWGRMKYEGHRARLENPVTFIGHHKLVNYKASYEKDGATSSQKLEGTRGTGKTAWFQCIDFEDRVVTSPALEFWKDSWERLAGALSSVLISLRLD
ncbi:hypothetical protein MPER_04093 [Moniliophthora perniciosa FA553]|nr:hypothetical protein MPER_04093 [Moniliophthora perniciosa FA553]